MELHKEGVILLWVRKTVRVEGGLEGIFRAEALSFQADPLLFEQKKLQTKLFLMPLEPGDIGRLPSGLLDGPESKLRGNQAFGGELDDPVPYLLLKFFDAIQLSRLLRCAPFGGLDGDPLFPGCRLGSLEPGTHGRTPGFGVEPKKTGSEAFPNRGGEKSVFAF